MGIKYLHKFLRDNSVNSIRLMHINQLRNKKIVVDINIYLYQYLAEDRLLEKTYMMLSLFKYYNIIPIFIFDGKPPLEKKYELERRRLNKLQAKQDLKEALYQLDNNNLELQEKEELITKIEDLKYQSVFLSKKAIEDVKQLIIAFGMTYYDALNEADELCALLVLKNKVWACMSDDSDMLAYGCHRVLRYFDLMKQNVLYYDLNGILDELGLTHEQLREICVLSCNDYNIEYYEIPKKVIQENEENQENKYKSNNKYNPKQSKKLKNYGLYYVLKQFKYYKKSKSNLKFKDWLIENNKLLINNEAIETFNKINNIYQLKNQNIYNEIINLKIFNGFYNSEKIRSLMKNDGFIFRPSDI